MLTTYELTLTSIRYDDGTLHQSIHPSIHSDLLCPRPCLQVFSEKTLLSLPPFPPPHQDHPHLSPLSLHLNPQPRNPSLKNTSRNQQTPLKIRKEITAPTTHVIHIHTISCLTPLPSLIIETHNRRSAVKTQKSLLPSPAIIPS